MFLLSSVCGNCGWHVSYASSPVRVSPQYINESRMQPGKALKLPNFFIIGAAKAGTTALYETLKQHHEIYMSPIKEPHFFGFESEPPVFPGLAGTYYRRTGVWRARDYGQLFAAVTHERAIGEASNLYMLSPSAAGRIKHNLPHSRIVAVLRQPAERAYSDYNSMVQNGVEPAGSFAEALAHETDRLREGWSLGLYRKHGYYHAQLSPYFELFPRQQIKIYLYEDWKNTPQAMLRDLSRFLEVDEDFTPDIRRSNVTRLPKNRRLHAWVTRPAWVEQRMPFLPSRVRCYMIFALQRVDARFNLAPPPALDPEIRACLTADYRDDILKLQDLIGRNLSYWLQI